MTLFSSPLSSTAEPQIFITITANDGKDFEIDYEEDEDFEYKDSIGICCAWGNSLADGRLTYYINDEDSSNMTLVTNMSTGIKILVTIPMNIFIK